MAVCKFCNKVIEELRSEATATTNALMDSEGEVIIDNEDDDIFETNEWRCVNCGRVIADNQYDAKEFLLNKDELKEMIAKKVNQKEVKNGRTRKRTKY